MSRNAYILEAFKQFNSLVEEDESIEREEIPMYDVDSEHMHDFLDAVGDDTADVDVIDLEAEAEEDLKQSYVGKVILDCNVCHSNIFVNKEDVIVNEDGICIIDLDRQPISRKEFLLFHIWEFVTFGFLENFK